MGTIQKTECKNGMWDPTIVPEATEKLRKCRDELEARHKVPFILKSKKFGTGANMVTGTEVVPDPACTNFGGDFSSSWFSTDANIKDAEACAARLRKLGYNTRTVTVPRLFIADAVKVVVDAAPAAAVEAFTKD